MRPTEHRSTQKAADKRFGRLQGGLGLPRLGLHGLRHTHATLLLEEGVDMKTVSERLGHKNVQTTLSIYAHVTPKMRLNAPARLAAVVDGAGKVSACVTIL